MERLCVHDAAHTLGRGGRREALGGAVESGGVSTMLERMPGGVTPAASISKMSSRLSFLSAASGLASEAETHT